MFGRLRAPVVITTTEHANADELQVSTTVEANTGDASASGCRSVTTPPTIASEASIRSCEELDRSHLHLAHRGGPEVGTGTGPYGDCRSTQCCVSVWSRWSESATRRVGFRALKKTLEAPYTTKVNNRDRTSRGTTLIACLASGSALSESVRGRVCCSFLRRAHLYPSLTVTLSSPPIHCLD